MTVEIKTAVTVSEMARMVRSVEGEVLSVDRLGLSIPALLGVYKASIF